MADTSTRGQPGSQAPPDEAIAPDGGSRRGPIAWARATPARLRGTIRGHWQFCIVLLAAVLMRVVVILGYPPIMWFNDSFNYFSDAVTHVPDNIRSNGYPFFLSLVAVPLHSVYLVAVLQAAMGATMGVAIYALLRRRGLPWWGAALPTLPVLFDVFELQLEHMVTADTLFTFLVTIALVVCCWRDRPSVLTMAVAGLLIGCAILVRSVGQPLLAVFVVGLLIRWVGWRQVAALALVAIVPVAAYMVWFHHTTGQYAITESRGTFLYSRVSTFAECSKMNPPADLRKLCDSTPIKWRPPSQEYLWDNWELIPSPERNQRTPLDALYGDDNQARFSPAVESLTQRFAILAITSQPYDYFRVVTRDITHTFGWDRQPDPVDTIGNGNGPEFRFSNSVFPVPWWASNKYPNDAQAMAIYQRMVAYLGASQGQPRVVHPWAGFIQAYQRVVWLRGPFLGLIILIGAAGAIGRWRRRGGIVLLPWLAGALLIVLPPMTAGFSYRYMVAAVPAVCLAAGLAFTWQPGERSVRALAADLGRYFGRSVPVEQE